MQKPNQDLIKFYGWAKLRKIEFTSNNFSLFLSAYKEKKKLANLMLYFQYFGAIGGIVAIIYYLA